MRTYYLAPFPPLHIADGGAFNTFTTAQDVGPLPAVTLPANLLETGTEVKLEAAGEFSNTATPTLGLGFMFGSTVLAVGTAITTTTGAASWPWYAEWVGRIRSVGTSGSVHGMGWWNIGTSLTAFGTLQAMPATLALRTVTIDTTAATKIVPAAVWGTSSVSNSIKVNRFSCTIVS